MARFYEIVKHNAQKFANERNQVVYICKAKRKTDYYIIFSPDQLTKNYDIMEEVYPETDINSSTEVGDKSMLKPFLIATHADYTAITLAKNSEDAIRKVADFYFEEYGEDRDDWVAYDLTTEYLEPDEVFEIKSFWA